MERQGVRKVWLTPHIMEDMPNETAALQQKFLRLKQKYQGKVELALAAEYMLDNLLRNGWKGWSVTPWGRKTLSVSGNFLFQSTNGATVYLQRTQKKVIIHCWPIRNGMNTCRRKIIRSWRKNISPFNSMCPRWSGDTADMCKKRPKSYWKPECMTVPVVTSIP